MLTFGMLKNLFALVFLALAVSPFTAPFQTCAEATAAVVAPLDIENDPGSLVSPLVTKAGRLTVAVAPPAGLGVSYFVPLARSPCSSRARATFDTTRFDRLFFGSNFSSFEHDYCPTEARGRDQLWA
jgi:hypothetical protein